MPHYITLMKWTDKGIESIKDFPKRAAALTKRVEQIGGGKVQVFVTMGEYDLVAISEAANDEQAMQAALEVGRAGNARTTTIKAWTLEEASKVVAKIP